MGVSSEATARAVIQRLRPAARKHGLRRAIVDCYLRKHLPEEFRSVGWDEMKLAPDYHEVRADAEYRRPPFTPDLSETYPEDREIILYEIQDRSPISRTKMKLIRNWLGVLDGWDSWSVALITTNGYGFGWHVLIDTVTAGKQCALTDFRQDPDSWVHTFPTLTSEEGIVQSYTWRNWRMPSPDEFDSVMRTMSFL